MLGRGGGSFKSEERLPSEGESLSKDLDGMRVGAIWIYWGRAFPEEPASAKAVRLMGPLCSETEREPVSLEQSEISITSDM